MAANVVEVLVKATDDTAEGFGKAKASADSAAEAQKAYADAVEDASKAEQEFRDAQTEAADAAERLAELQKDDAASADELAAALDRQTQASLRSMDAQLKLGAADARVAETSKLAGDAQEEQGAKTDESSGLMAGAGSKVKMALLGVAVGAGVAVDAAMKFQAATTTLVTSAGEKVAQLGMLQRGILGISSQTATSTTELIHGLYMISSSGITGAGGLNVLKAAAEGAKSEGADLNEVTNALTSGINAYGMKTKTSAEATASATSMMNQMLATVSAGKMTFEQLASSLSAVLPVAAANKIAYAQVGGALATMTSMGMSARQGTQDLAATIRALSNVQGPANTEMSAFGISAVDVESHLGQRGLTGTVQMLSNAITSKMGPAGLVIVNAMNQSKSAAADANEMLGKLPASIQGVARAYLDGTASYTTFNNATKAAGLQTRTMAQEFASVAGKAHGFNTLLASGTPAAQTYSAALGKMLGGATGLNVGLMLTGAHAATFAGNVKSIGEKAGGASGQVSGFSEVTKTTAFQLQQVEDSLKAAGIELGMVLLPAVSAILKPLGEFLSMVAQNKAEAIALAVVVGGVLAGAIGTKAVHALKDMKSAIKDTGEGIEWLLKKVGLMDAGTDAQAASAKAAAASTEEANAAAAASSEAEAAAVEESNSGMIASTGAWIAEHAVAAASFIAENVTMAASATAAFIAENAATLGLVTVIAALVAAIIYLALHWKQVWADIKMVALDAWHFIDDDLIHPLMSGIDSLVKWVESHWKLLAVILATILLGPVGGLVVFIATHWAEFRRLTSDLVNDVTGFFETLPGRILSALAALPSMLFHAGVNAIEGLLHGMESMMSGALHTVEGWGHDVANALGSPFGIHFSEPSEAGQMVKAGQQITKGLGRGMLSGLPSLAAAAHQVAGAAGIGPGGASGAASAGGGQLVLQLGTGGSGLDQMFMSWLKAAIRTNGGDPRILTRKVQFLGSN